MGLPEVGAVKVGKWMKVAKREKFPVIKSIRSECVIYSMI